MKKQKIETEFEESSGNVFTDLGFPDAEEMLVKADLAIQINELIKKKKLTQSQAAKLLNIDQSEILRLNNEKLFAFSYIQLFKFLTILGQDVTIQIKPKSKSKAKAGVHVSLPRTNKRKVPVKQENPHDHRVHAKTRKK